ncbi:MAG: 16S rRNA (cytosine(967)-C(5))-methyltransferase, partial [Parasporobacterium sp.]|nr:16S rRNA (cytosine(967)-C(5))-methyltransferase [Parasporobacterium sp.]
MKTDNIRNTVLNMLNRTLDEGRFSHIVLNETLSEYELSYQDKAFLNRLYMGVLEKCIYLDYVLDAYSRTPVRKMKPVIRNILRMGLY